MKPFKTFKQFKSFKSVKTCKLLKPFEPISYSRVALDSAGQVPRPHSPQ